MNDKNERIEQSNTPNIPVPTKSGALKHGLKIRDKNDNECYNYTSEMLKVEDDCEYCDSIDEAKELSETIKQYVENQKKRY